MPSPNIAQWLTELEAAVTRNKEVDQSAIALLNGFSARLAKAISDALAAGASEAELASLQTFANDVKGSTTELASAVEANTPAA